ncbi:hypothetical protein V6N13_065465 [Hibiscus sabdariffa]
MVAWRSGKDRSCMSHNVAGVKEFNLFIEKMRAVRCTNARDALQRGVTRIVSDLLQVSLRLLTLILAFLGFIVLRGRDTLVCKKLLRVWMGKLCLWSWEYLGVQFQISWYIGGGGNDKTINLMNLQCRILLLLKIRHSHLVVLHCVDTVR